MAHAAPQQSFGPIEAHTALAGNTFSGYNITFNGVSGISKGPLDIKEACLRSLEFSGMHSRQQDILHAQPDTCDWFFDTSEFHAWRNPALLYTHHGVLWVKGKPGAGKSTLMKHALARYQDDLFRDYLIVTYFFNARGDTFEKSPLGLLRSIVYQLIKHDDKLSVLRDTLFQSKTILDSGTNVQWRISELQDFVRSVIIKHACSRPILLLVDALDECIESDARDVAFFLESLGDQAIKSGFGLRICLSSRHYPAIRMTKCIELILERNSAHQTDINTYIREKLRSPDHDIQAQIADRADGIFLWVVIVVSLLNKIYDEGRVEETQRALMDIPSSLDEIFSGILGNLDDASETLLILQWVLLSERPLSPRELFAAVTRLPLPDIELIKRRITTSSKGLVELRKGKRSVQFIHLSVNDFLFRQQRLRRLDPTLGADPITAIHGRLWTRCQQSLEQAATTEADVEEMGVYDTEADIHPMGRPRAKDPFIRYAVDFILEHAEKVISNVTRQSFHETDACPSPDSPQQSCIKQWLQMSSLWFEWWKRFRTRYNWVTNSVLFQNHSRIGLHHTLVHCGKLGLLQASLVGADINMQDDQDGTLLQAACLTKTSNVEIAKWLISAGVDVNAQGGLYGNALQAAAYRGSLDVIELLLNAGADVNAQGGNFGSALQAAAHVGSLDVIELLLNAGADVNAQGGYFGNALQAAAHAGSLDVIELLLNAGADVNAQGGYYSNALQAAAHAGSLDVTELLLNAGADINAQGGDLGNALQAAARGGSLDVTELLLNAGADVNAQGGDFGSTLQAAVRGGSLDVTELLLNAGADINAQGGGFGSALHAAASETSEDVVQVLLDAGANINARSGTHGTALSVAVHKGQRRIVQLLLARGADRTLVSEIELSLLLGSEEVPPSAKRPRICR